MEGIYDVLTITFLNSAVHFPSDFKLQLFFFLMPVLGIGILPRGWLNLAFYSLTAVLAAENGRLLWHPLSPITSC